MKCKTCLDGRIFKPEPKEYVKSGGVLRSYDSDFAIWHCNVCLGSFIVPRKGKIVYKNCWDSKGKVERRS